MHFKYMVITLSRCRWLIDITRLHHIFENLKNHVNLNRT